MCIDLQDPKFIMLSYKSLKITQWSAMISSQQGNQFAFIEK